MTRQMFKYHPNKMKTPNLWSDSNTSNLGSGWYRSSWFGDFYNNQGGWSYHLYHGWLYIHGNDESQLWVYDDSLGWLYTGKNYTLDYIDTQPHHGYTSQTQLNGNFGTTHLHQLFKKNRN